MVSISGVRGIVGKTLTPEVIVKYVSAFAEYSGHGKIVIGRDGRSSGAIIGNLVSSTLLSMGCDVIALGIVPTPTVGLAVEQMHAAGGISITASHNPMEWNGLKFIGPSGMFLNGDENRRMWAIADRSNVAYAAWDKLGKHERDDSFLQRHVDQVLRLPSIDIEKIRSRKFKVVVDCINAAGGRIVPQLLRTMGCTVIELNCDVSGVFSRPAEPVPENLTQLCDAVIREKADIGIAVDPDVDRLVLITEKGQPFGEEYTVTSAIKFILEHSPKGATKQSVVVNLSTTRAVDDVATANGAAVYRTPVGEINVAQKMKDIESIVGGEGSGGVILPAVHYGREAIVGIGLIMQQLAEFSGTVSQFKDSLPQYSIVKAKVDIPDRPADGILAEIAKSQQKEGAINQDDGLKISFERSWVHLRKSNTEPLIRIIAEAPDIAEAKALV